MNTVELVAEQCRSAGWGCLDCKKVLYEGMERDAGVRSATRAADIQSRPGHVEEVLGDGGATARRVARDTLREVKEIMGLSADAGLRPRVVK